MKAMPDRKHTFEWLDTLIEKLKHPTGESTSDDLSMKDIDVITCAENEINLLELRIREDVFSRVSPKKNRRLIVNYYHDTITYYINILYAVSGDSDKDGTQWCNQLQSLLKKPLDYLEIHFSDYLKKDRKISKYDLSSAKQSMKIILNRILERVKIIECGHTQRVIGIVNDTMDKFIMQTKYPYSVTHQCVHYRLELLKKIISLPVWEPDQDLGQFPLDNLLILMNFNSKSYISYLTSCISESVHHSPNSYKFELLLGYYKGLRQLHVDPNQFFNPTYYNIMDVLTKWFEEEVSYFREMGELKYQPEVKKKTSDQKYLASNVKNKVVFALSSDQVALLLRAADETRILSARSLNAVFQSIVPYISTKKKADLSYRSVRTKSYNAEEGDKAIAIRTLQKMIEKIQDY